MNQPSPAGRRPAKRGNSWTLPDKINMAGVIIALVALISPWAYHIYQQHFKEPHAAIETPMNGQVFDTNRIAVRGTAGNVAADSDLWLSASGPSDEVYPIAELQVNAGRWSANEKQVCFRIGPGQQRIDVWLSPDTNDGEFVGYMQGNHSFGFFSVPDGFIKLYQVNIYVRHHPLKNC
jgi:hypothetical protein